MGGLTDAVAALAARVPRPMDAESAEILRLARAHMSAGEVERLTAWIAARLGRRPGDAPDRGLLGGLEHMLRRWLTAGQRRQLLRLMARRAVAGASLVPDEDQDLPAAPPRGPAGGASRARRPGSLRRR